MSDDPTDTCGLCGGPILPDDDAKVPHPVHWPGERCSETDIVHVTCEHDECGRAHAALSDQQRAAFLRSL